MYAMLHSVFSRECGNENISETSHIDFLSMPSPTVTNTLRLNVKLKVIHSAGIGYFVLLLTVGKSIGRLSSTVKL